VAKNNGILFGQIVLYYGCNAPGRQTRATDFFIITQAFFLGNGDTGPGRRKVAACFAMVLFTKGVPIWLKN
jgi:hypothetical protein